MTSAPTSRYATTRRSPCQSRDGTPNGSCAVALGGGAARFASRSACQSALRLVSSAKFYASFIMLRHQERSVKAQKDSPHGPEPEKTHSRARLPDLDRTWLCARPSRAALACGRTGTVGDIDGSPRRQTRSEEEPTVARTFEDRQNAREGWLTLRISPGDQHERRRVRLRTRQAIRLLRNPTTGIARVVTGKPTPSHHDNRRPAPDVFGSR
jgi:hypothetical protein